MEKDTELRAIFSRRLKATRLLRKERQTDVVRRTRIASQALCDYEHGRRAPTIERLVILAKSLRVSTDYLLGLADVPTQAQTAADPLTGLFDALSKDEQQLMIKIVRVTVAHIARQRCCKK